MSAPSLAWYVRRLRRMSPVEVAGRGADALRRVTWARRQVEPGAAVPAPADLLPGREFTAVLPESLREDIDPALVARVVAAADAVLAGTGTVLGVERTDLARPDWFFDPVTGRRAPADQLAFRVQHRDEERTGNVKQIWELSRHHHLTVVATAYWLTGDERYAELVADQLRSWWVENPFLSGVHWTNGIEVGIRLVSWAWIRRLLDGWPKVGDLFEHDDDAVAQIGWHQEFLTAFPSRGSSANNHLVAEAAGRVVAANAFPWYARSAGWRRRASRQLEHALETNTLADGVNAELATDYHRFVVELALVAAVEADASGHPLSRTTWARVATMLDAGAAMLDVRGRAPRQGDGDEGRALVLDPHVDPWTAALSSGASLLPPPAWWPTLPHDIQGRLLASLAGPRAVPRPDAAPRWFPDAGMALLRSATQDGPEIWVRCDGGPHGFSSIAAHAHADALSVEVRHDGVDLLSDPGTYCYHGEPEWRAWFRSTGAHNTVQVAGRDQSVSGGPFLWSTRARTTTLEHDLGAGPVQSWSAEHDGYRRLPTPVVHRRSVRLDSPGRLLTVTDVVEGPGTSEVAVAWHLGPEVTVELRGTEAVLHWSVGPEQRTGRLVLSPELAWTLHRGEEHPPRGWYSARFGSRTPSSMLLGRTTSLPPEARIETRLELP